MLPKRTTLFAASALLSSCACSAPAAHVEGASDRNGIRAASPLASTNLTGSPPAEVQRSKQVYIGYEPMRGMPAEEPSDLWYHQDRLTVDGDRLLLEQSPVFCRNGELWWSVSDGGFYRYEGSVSNGPNGVVANFNLVGCDHCGHPTTGSPNAAAHTGLRDLPLVRRNESTLLLGKVIYRNDVAEDDRTCPDRRAPDDAR